MLLIETNLDDISVEFLGGDFQQLLLEAGAVDFFFTSVQMKKGRPGLKLSVLTGETQLEAVTDFILEHTSGRAAAWDCGTGTGQVARELAHHFQKVIACHI